MALLSTCRDADEFTGIYSCGAREKPALGMESDGKYWRWRRLQGGNERTGPMPRNCGSNPSQRLIVD